MYIGWKPKCADYWSKGDLNILACQGSHHSGVTTPRTTTHWYQSYPSCWGGIISNLNNLIWSPRRRSVPIKTLISTKRPHPKEDIQSSRLDQCALQATTAQQYVTLEIPSELISTWKREGYTHLHLGGVRLILTLHGRKGLPATARIALLDTRFKQYQHAIIGTVLTTLHAGLGIHPFKRYKTAFCIPNAHYQWKNCIIIWLFLFRKQVFNLVYGWGKFCSGFQVLNKANRIIFGKMTFLFTNETPTFLSVRKPEIQR